MYNPNPVFHCPDSCTPSHPKPNPQAIRDSTINILGLNVPKSAYEPRTRNTTICIAKEMPLHSNTMLLIVRTLPKKGNLILSSPPTTLACSYTRFCAAVGAKLNSVKPLLPM